MTSGYLPNPGNSVQAADVAAHARTARDPYLAGLLDPGGDDGTGQAG